MADSDSDIKSYRTSLEVNLELSNPEPLQSTKRRRLVILALVFLLAVDFMNYSAISPFYPPLAKERGVNVATIGLIFASFRFAMSVSSFAFGKLMMMIGSKATLIGGGLLSGGCMILLGALDEIHDTTTFTVYSFILRVGAGVGTGSVTTAVYALAVSLYPTDVTTVTGSLDMCIGFGAILGPAAGGLLTQIGGFKLPCFVIGGVEVLVILLLLCIKWQGPSEKENGAPARGQVTLRKLFSIPAIPMLSATMMALYSVFGYIDVGLGIYLKQLELSPVAIGGVFIVLAVSFAIMAPVVGTLVDKTKIIRPIIIMGFPVSLFGFLLLGPSPLFHLHSELWMIIFGLLVIGVGLALNTTPIYADMLRTALRNGFPDDLQTYSLVSGILTSTSSLGLTIGPLIGGPVIHIVKFPWASTIFGGVTAIIGVLFLLFTLCEFHCSNSIRNDSTKYGPTTEEKREPILGNEKPKETSSVVMF